MRRLVLFCIAAVVANAACLAGSALAVRVGPGADQRTQPNTDRSATRAARADLDRNGRRLPRGGGSRRTPHRSFLFGDAAIEPDVRADLAGTGAALAFDDGTGGRASAINVYVGSHSTAAQLTAGLFSDANHGPGFRLALGSIHRPTPGAWNTVPIRSTRLRAGETYWVAILATGGSVNLRGVREGGCYGQSSWGRNLRSLPRKWVNGARGRYCPVSTYVSGLPAPARAQQTDGSLPLSGLYVSGNQLVNSNGRAVRLRGVDRAGTEYLCAQQSGIFDGTNALDDTNVLEAISTWKGVNSVLYGLNEDCWLGINGVPAQYSGQNYISAIEASVRDAEEDGLYPVIGYSWGDGGTTPALSQPPMPDNDHAPLFWEEVANTFKNDPRVIFRLQEEPHPYNRDSRQAWRCWSQGDVQYTSAADQTPPTPPTPSGKLRHCLGDTSFADGAVGMQSLINIIRGTGAKNVIQVPGSLWASEVQCSGSRVVSPINCGFLDSADGIRVRDTLNPPQLMADLDLYMQGGGPNNNLTAWTHELLPVAQVMPVDAGELGEDVNLASTTMQPVTRFLNWADAHGISYYAWAWNAWPYADALVTSSGSGEAKSPWGTLYRSHVFRF